MHSWNKTQLQHFSFLFLKNAKKIQTIPPESHLYLEPNLIHSPFGDRTPWLNIWEVQRMKVSANPADVSFSQQRSAKCGPSEGQVWWGANRRINSWHFVGVWARGGYETVQFHILNCNTPFVLPIQDRSFTLLPEHGKMGQMSQFPGEVQIPYPFVESWTPNVNCSSLLIW